MLLTYTFDTKFARELKKVFPDIFIFKKLHKDLKKFTDQIHKPRLKRIRILGIAKSPYKYSQFETTTINQFNRTKMIIKEAPKKYKLHVPRNVPKGFMIAEEPTDSFCNWTMFRIAHFINEKKIDARLSFVHVILNDISELKQYM